MLAVRDFRVFAMEEVVNITVAARVENLQQSLQSVKVNLDVMFRVVIAGFIFFMQSGFAFLECGSVRRKNATNILVKNMTNVLVAAIAFWVCGYALSVGSGSGFMGYSHFLASGAPSSGHERALFFSHWFFSYTVAATPATMLSGAMAERCRFTACLIISFIITGIVHPVAAHWCWNVQGWLYQGGYKDFAGAGVVHLLGGCCALLASVMLGPRQGKFGLLRAGRGNFGFYSNRCSIRGHSIPLSALGGFILLFGFIGFTSAGSSNIGYSLYHVNDGVNVCKAAVNIILAASSGAFTALVINYLPVFGQKWSFLITLNGALCAMVTCSASADTHDPVSSVIMGFFAGILFIILRRLLDVMVIDDPIDTIAVHLGGGGLGLVMGPLFAVRYGLFSTGDGRALAWNVLGGVCIVLWCCVTCGPLFYILKLKNRLRVTAEEEEKGLDITKHNEPAYPAEAYGHGWGDTRSKIDQLLALTAKSAMKTFGKDEQQAVSSRMGMTRRRMLAAAEHPELEAAIKQDTWDD